MIIQERCGICCRETLSLSGKTGNVGEHHCHHPFHGRNSSRIAAADEALHQRLWNIGREPAQAHLHGVEGFALYVENHVLYAHYARRADALADQANAGAVMWLSAGTPILLALLWCVADWGARERRAGAAYDARERRGELAPAPGRP